MSKLSKCLVGIILAFIGFAVVDSIRKDREFINDINIDLEEDD